MKKVLKHQKFIKGLMISLLFLEIPAMVMAQDRNLTTNDYERTDRTVEARIYKIDNGYTIKLLTVRLLPYPFSRDETLKGKRYNGNVKSFLGKTLGYFPADEMVIIRCREEFQDDGTIIGGCEEVPEGDLLLYMPYFNNGKYADIYNPDNKKILTIDLSAKATCNENNRCDTPVEDSLNCSMDCRNREPAMGYSNSQNNEGVFVQSSQQTNASEETEKQTPWYKNIYVWIGVALSVLIFIIFKIKRKEKTDDYYIRG
ncbi:MAG TPA: hypothetical protein VJH06_02890 [Candidatus Paceibacterota bacterium]